jgi:hypothetical protein
MDKATVTLRSKVGNFATTFTDPNGKPIIFKWNKANNFTVEVPRVITFVDIRGVKKVAAEDYATDLLNAYGKEEYKHLAGGASLLDKDGNKTVIRQAILELVEEKKAPQVVPPVAENKKDTGSIELAK